MRLRARLLKAIRAHFNSEGVTEVTTPVLNEFGSCEPTIQNIKVTKGKKRFLRTSSESALKQILTLNIGDLFEIGPVFRDEEQSRTHLQEFTMVEWYRIDTDLFGLIADVKNLLKETGYLEPIAIVTYKDLFTAASGINPHNCTNEELGDCAIEGGLILESSDSKDKGFLLDAVYATKVEPYLKAHKPVFIVDYPIQHRAYARLSKDEDTTALRFELIINGIEIANGYDEIIDSNEQKERFEEENALRERRGLEPMVSDPFWLNALEIGIPRTCGVALGLERLQMILQQVDDIEKTKVII